LEVYKNPIRQLKITEKNSSQADMQRQAFFLELWGTRYFLKKNGAAEGTRQHRSLFTLPL